MDQANLNRIDLFGSKLITLLTRHKTTFASSHADMYKIDPQVITHELSIMSSAIPL